jgi:hypothetical protein
MLGHWLMNKGFAVEVIEFVAIARKLGLPVRQTKG